MQIGKTLADFYINKHKSCGGCQKRWKGIQNKFNMHQTPEFLNKRVKENTEMKRVLDTLFKGK